HQAPAPAARNLFADVVRPLDKHPGLDPARNGRAVKAAVIEGHSAELLLDALDRRAKPVTGGSRSRPLLAPLQSGVIEEVHRAVACAWHLHARVVTPLDEQAGPDPV